ncbi:MAG: tetratricopeptide repeat protein [Candidatus Babeliales bacterium]
MNRIVVVWFILFCCEVHLVEGSIFSRIQAVYNAHQDDWEKAAEQLKASVVDNHGSFDILFDTGVALYKVGDYEQACAYFKKAASLEKASNHEKEKAYFNTGMSQVALYTEKQNIRYLYDACEEYRRLLALNPHNEKAQHNLHAIKAMIDSAEKADKEEDASHHNDSSSDDSDKRENQDNNDTSSGSKGSSSDGDQQGDSTSTNSCDAGMSDQKQTGDTTSTDSNNGETATTDKDRARSSEQKKAADNHKEHKGNRGASEHYSDQNGKEQRSMPKTDETHNEIKREQENQLRKTEKEACSQNEQSDKSVHNEVPRKNQNDVHEEYKSADKDFQYNKNRDDADMMDDTVPTAQDNTVGQKDEEEVPEINKKVKKGKYDKLDRAARHILDMQNRYEEDLQRRMMQRALEQGAKGGGEAINAW